MKEYLQYRNHLDTEPEVTDYDVDNLCEKVEKARLVCIQCRSLGVKIEK